MTPPGGIPGRHSREKREPATLRKMPDSGEKHRVAESGRTVSLDVGTKTIGVAVSDELGITANGVETIRRRNEDSDLAELKKIAERYSPSRLVVGLPYDQDGSLGERGRRIKRFSRRVGDFLGLEVRYWDESFSTRTAEGTLVKAGLGRKRRRAVVDKMAAAVILEEYLLSGR